MKHLAMPPRPAVSWDTDLKVRQQSLFEMGEYFRGMTDGIGMPIDEDIFEVVVAMNIHGFRTRQSCAGHDSEERGRYLSPWIDTLVEDTPELIQQKRLLSKLQRKSDRMERALQDSNFVEDWGVLRAIESQMREIITALKQPAEQEHLRIFRLLQDFYICRPIDYDTQIVIFERPNGIELSCHGGPTLNARPADQRAAALASYQREFRAFGEFLIQKYLSV